MDWFTWTFLKVHVYFVEKVHAKWVLKENIKMERKLKNGIQFIIKKLCINIINYIEVEVNMMKMIKKMENG